MPPLTYEQSGVSVAEQDAAIAAFKTLVESTHGPEVLAGVGAFGAAYAPADWDARMHAIIGRTAMIPRRTVIDLDVNLPRVEPDE